MEVDAKRLVKILERIQKRLSAYDESFAMFCAIEAVRELDRIQSKSEQSKKEDK